MTDPDLIHQRAKAVHALLDGLPLRASLHASETRVGYPGRDTNPDGTPTGPVNQDLAEALFDAAAGRVSYLDIDGDRRRIDVPEGASAPAVASMVYALGSVRDWVE